MSPLPSPAYPHRFVWSRTPHRDEHGILMLEYTVRYDPRAIPDLPEKDHEVAGDMAVHRWERPLEINRCHHNPEPLFLEDMGDQLAAELGAVWAWAWAEDQTPPRETFPFVPELRCLPDPE